MHERREPQPPIPARCLTYAFQARRRTTGPAQCPGCGVLVSVSLGCAPSLHHLRRLIALVRRLPRYMSASDFSTAVGSGVWHLAFPEPPGGVSPGSAEISQL